MFNLLAFLNHVNAKTCLGVLLAQRLKSAPYVVIGKKTPESKARDLQKRLESVGLRVELMPVLSLAASANREKGLEMARLKKRLREQIRAELMKEMGLAPKRRRQRVFFLAGFALLAAVVSVSASLPSTSKTRLLPTRRRQPCATRQRRTKRCCKSSCEWPAPKPCKAKLPGGPARAAGMKRKGNSSRCAMPLPERMPARPCKSACWPSTRWRRARWACCVKKKS